MPTHETTITVESCLAELREMFPDVHSEIAFTTRGTVRVTVWENDIIPRRRCSRSTLTLEETMMQIRDWEKADDD